MEEARQPSYPQSSASDFVAPITSSERMVSLDLIRGIAILGILIMNIQSFGNLFATYFNPTINGDFSGLNQITWFITHIFFEQKFYTIFSMLFGAGIVVMAEKASAKGLSAAKYHYRRSVLLILFGLLHGYLIWYGDILNIYGLFALIVFLMWKKSPRFQIVSGLVLILLLSGFMLLGYLAMPAEDAAQMQSLFIPSEEVIAKEIAAYQGTWSESFAQRIEAMAHMFSFIGFGIFRITGCMLLGMAFYKLGIFSAQRSKQFYWKLIYWCLLPGLAMATYSAYALNQSGFLDAKTVQMKLAQYNYLGSLLMAIGYIGMFNLFFLSEGFKKLKQRLQAVGQMAFTNYITQSLICTSLFYGFGLGLFSMLSRFEMVLVAILVLALQMVWSPWWLKKFRFGPLEWLWRSLTYFKLQPMKRH
ncbi:DUF418 domain-containing protein [Aliikangiella marina]|uniref:DUF418 domain-containing protein n=1 Tax=Aliikangiella marina TaxID=1712262 RepID=A0A545TDL0_9GAMM|nr:DUF418 domain-containing protein [Aliikangiella marina]TQV75256.1 DUF418 domain-containing protein [Aliikangiella marina]